MSENRKGKGKLSLEQRAHLSVLAKEREARKREQGGWSDEARQKASEASKRRVNTKHSDETKAKIAKANTGRTLSEEHKQKLRDAHARRTPEERSAAAQRAGEAASKVIKGKKRDPEAVRKAVETRREKNSGSYWAGGRSASINMEPGPAPDEGPQEYTGEYPKMSEARRRGLAEGKGVGWEHTPETIEQMRETRKQMWADGVYKDKKPATRRRVSRMELSLVPYLERLGYEHVDSDNHFFVYHPEKGMVPDFVDREGKRVFVFEFFGDFWHAPEDEPETIRRYAERGWTCTVLWEHDLDRWIETHTSTV